MVTRKLIVAVPPAAGSVPTLTATLVSPGELPSVTAPALVCTEPTTSGVVVSGMSTSGHPGGGLRAGIAQGEDVDQRVAG